MPLIDQRSAMGMEHVNQLLLQVAKEPYKHLSALPQVNCHAPGDEVHIAARLARQACASIICNCHLELWSETVALLHALEPDFPYYPPRVSKFVEETRLPFLSYIRLYYSLNKREFAGTPSELKAKTVVDLRNDLEHDKPEGLEDWSNERLEKLAKWRKRLEPLVGKDALRWLPTLPYVDPLHGFLIVGEPVVTKFMKYPVAEWAIQATSEVRDEMRQMLFSYPGRKRYPGEHCPASLSPKDADPDLWRLWRAAIGADPPRDS